MKSSLSAQSAAIATAREYAGRAPPKMREAEIELLRRSLTAAHITLLVLQHWRDLLPKELFAEIEGSE